MKSWELFALLLPCTAFADEPVLPEPVRKVVTDVCGFCHFPDFFDEATGELVEQRFLDKAPLILDRLQRPVGAAGRMPPKRSPVALTEEERQSLVDFLKAPEPVEQTPLP